MRRVGLWKIAGSRPERLRDSEVNLEKQLEEWIESDPALLQSGLVIVGRQITLEGGRLDLLGLDPQGRWAVIEVKRGALQRKSVAQVIDYASCLEELSAEEFRAPLDTYLETRGERTLDELLEERGAADSIQPGQRDLGLFVVGTGRTPGLNRMGKYLADKFSLPLSIVTFDVFFLDDSESILVREITESEGTQALPTKSTQVPIDQVIQLADRQGLGQIFRDCVKVAHEVGLYPRPWKKCLMFAPRANRTRALFTVWASAKEGKASFWVGDDVFSEFFGVSRPAVERHLGPGGWHYFSEGEARRFLSGLKALLESAAEDSDDEQGNES